MTTHTAHPAHADHDHVHGDGCGHQAVQHGDHIDYLHDGHAHHEHNGHWDDCDTCSCANCSDDLCATWICDEC